MRLHISCEWSKISYAELIAGGAETRKGTVVQKMLTPGCRRVWIGMLISEPSRPIWCIEVGPGTWGFVTVPGVSHVHAVTGNVCDAQAGAGGRGRGANDRARGSDIFAAVVGIKLWLFLRGDVDRFVLYDVPRVGGRGRERRAVSLGSSKFGPAG